MTDAVLSQFRKFYGSEDDDAVIAATEERFLLAPAADRKTFVDNLRDQLLEEGIGMSERAERLALERRFRGIHDGLRRLGR
jgi:hypothetical protein